MNNTYLVKNFKQKLMKKLKRKIANHFDPSYSKSNQYTILIPDVSNHSDGNGVSVDGLPSIKRSML